MRHSDWIEAVLPKVADRLYRELLLLDPVLNESACSPITAATYHPSRHLQSLTATPIGNSEAPMVSMPSACKVPVGECKAYALSQALLACQRGSPGIGGQVVFRYVGAARSAWNALRKLLKDFSPATKALVGQLRSQQAGLSSDGKALLNEAACLHDDLLRAWKRLPFLGEAIADEVCPEDMKVSLGKKHDQHHLDRITEPLLGCYSDKEIADLVPDGDEPGDNNEWAVARVANRRKKLTGSRKGGRLGKPGRPRKTHSET